MPETGELSRLEVGTGRTDDPEGVARPVESSQRGEGAAGIVRPPRCGDGTTELIAGRPGRNRPTIRDRDPERFTDPPQRFVEHDRTVAGNLASSVDIDLAGRNKVSEVAYQPGTRPRANTSAYDVATKRPWGESMRHGRPPSTTSTLSRRNRS